MSKTTSSSGPGWMLHVWQSKSCQHSLLVQYIGVFDSWDCVSVLQPSNSNFHVNFLHSEITNKQLEMNASQILIEPKVMRMFWLCYVETSKNWKYIELGLLLFALFLRYWVCDKCSSCAFLEPNPFWALKCDFSVGSAPSCAWDFCAFDISKHFN
jgi:hypothetical protein